MAEVGLLPFAGIALQVCRAVLPRYRSRFSKHLFTQPQLLTILCLMRYEDWTFREAEVRLGEHRELRQALGLASVPDFTTLYRFLQRLDDQTIDRAVGETVRRLRGTRRRGRRRARVAVDATGLAQGAVSTFFVRRMHYHGQKALPWRHWLKWIVVVDLDQQFLLSQISRRGPWNDCANLPAVVEAASEQTRTGWCWPTPSLDSERNHTYIRQQLGAQSVIPAKRGKKSWRIQFYRVAYLDIMGQRRKLLQLAPVPRMDGETTRILRETAGTVIRLRKQLDDCFEGFGKPTMYLEGLPPEARRRVLSARQSVKARSFSDSIIMEVSFRGDEEQCSSMIGV